jgi:alanyl-tRNA synthetase
MTSSQIRQSFLDFFAARGHRIVPSAPVIPHGDATLLFTNAGMNQFKDVFLGTGKREYLRAADTQKCIRVSGKHNDLEEVGRDTYHHTFFEMLGNWSFGDYYKREAIGWAWELLTSEWGVDKTRLYATVYESDDEAERLWTEVTDIDPSHVLRFGKKDNFWEMGDTGPCGPCSEIHVDLTADRSGRLLVNAGDPRVMEIWNLVFIQNNRSDRGELEQLPARHVDTGMGFERMCAVLQGKTSNYDTDVFMPIIDAIASATGVAYAGEPERVAMRVIADHIRMLSFAIADGAIPGNDGRGYVLRRILRRAARFGRNLGMREPFIHTLAGAVAVNMGRVFPEIVEKQNHIRKVLKAEEESFNITLDRGLEIFTSVLERAEGMTAFPGDEAFKLYDTYGFPLDLTEMMASERGLAVDTARFEELMNEQKRRARESDKMKASSASIASTGMFDGVSPARFVGYESVESPARVNAVVDGKFIALDRTPFYVESGGQVDDTGTIEAEQFAVEVIDSFKSDARILHEVRLIRGSLNHAPGTEVIARVDRSRRTSIQRNHSATHLLHEALRRVLGSHAHQHGSLVAPDHLRFDFPHFGKLSAAELHAIEEMVNGKIADGIAVETAVDLPIDKARKIPNVKMFFGDKYGDLVRVVTIDPAFSVEFCGGTHVHKTSDIGPFKIISETGIASGVRRIEAVTGEGLRTHIEQLLAKAGEVTDHIGTLLEEAEALQKELGVSPAGSRNTNAPLHIPSLDGSVDRETYDAISSHLERQSAALEEAGKTVGDLRKELARRRVAHESAGIEGILERSVEAGGIRLARGRVEALSMDELKSLGDTLRGRLGSGVGVLASVVDGKVALVCVVTDDLVARGKVHAGTFAGVLAAEVGGRGGGRPHLATAGGKDVDRLDAMLEKTPALLAAGI